VIGVSERRQRCGNFKYEGYKKGLQLRLQAPLFGNDDYLVLAAVTGSKPSERPVSRQMLRQASSGKSTLQNLVVVFVPPERDK